MLWFAKGEDPNMPKMVDSARTVESLMGYMEEQLKSSGDWVEPAKKEQEGEAPEPEKDMSQEGDETEGKQQQQKQQEEGEKEQQGKEKETVAEESSSEELCFVC